MNEREIIELAYNVRQKQKEYFKRYDRSVLGEAKKLEKMLDEALDGYFHPEKKVRQNDLLKCKGEKMEDYNIEDRLITKDDWEEWLKSKEEYSDKRLSNMPETPTKKETKYAVIEWHPYPDEKPTKDGLFLITHKFGNRKEVAMAYLTKDINSNNLIAWAELPKPYKEEKHDKD